MFIKKIKIISALFGAVAVLSIMPSDLYVSAKNINIAESAPSRGTNDVLSKEIYVSDIFELLQALDNTSPWGKIFLKNDINMSGVTLVIKKSVVIDLNGHSIFVDKNSGGIVIESKYSADKKKIIREYSSDYTWNENKHKVEKPFFGGDGYNLTIVDYEERNEYNDDLYVMIKNGSVTHEEGGNGSDGEPGTWLKCSGKNGETPSAPITLNSGVLSLSNMKVMGGNGGQGGNGSHYPWPHLPFSGGCGADGGDGGNGGSAISVKRREAKLIIDKNSQISAGLPGSGGKYGEPSSEYWFYKSKPGVNGKRGKINPNIEYKYKK